MKLWVISDLHLKGPSDPWFEKLNQGIQTQLHPSDVLVFAGDLFDLYLGNKSFFYRRYESLFKTLEEALSKGLKIYWIEGNHDFLLEKRGIKNKILYCKKELILEFNKKKFYLAHGDLVNSTDYKYLLLRALLRSFFTRLFITLMPGKWIQKIGNWASQKSRKKNNFRNNIQTDKISEKNQKIFRDFAKQKFQNGFSYVVLGHSHIRDYWTWNERIYLNLGFPPEHGTVAVWNSETSEWSWEVFGPV